MRDILQIISDVLGLIRAFRSFNIRIPLIQVISSKLVILAATVQIFSLLNQNQLVACSANSMMVLILLRGRDTP